MHLWSAVRYAYGRRSRCRRHPDLRRPGGSVCLQGEKLSADAAPVAQVRGLLEDPTDPWADIADMSGRWWDWAGDGSASRMPQNHAFTSSVISTIVGRKPAAAKSR